MNGRMGSSLRYLGGFGIEQRGEVVLDAGGGLSEQVLGRSQVRIALILGPRDEIRCGAHRQEAEYHGTDELHLFLSSFSAGELPVFPCVPPTSRMFKDPGKQLVEAEGCNHPYHQRT